MYKYIDKLRKYVKSFCKDKFSPKILRVNGQTKKIKK